MTDFRGYGSPRTERGRAQAYGPPPWRLAGRGLALWFRLADPAEARRHVPAMLEMDDDPIVRARFWDLAHDAGLPERLAPGDDLPLRVAEAVVAFPVSYAGTSGDFTAHMYADDPVYTAFGREVMGWPLRPGTVVMSPGLPAGLERGSTVSARLERDGGVLMSAGLTLTAPIPVRERPIDLPRWLTLKLVPRADGSGDVVRQLLQTGPERVEWGPMWAAEGELRFMDGPNDELAFLAPREIVAAQFWSAVDLSIGYGRILADASTAGGGARL